MFPEITERLKGTFEKWSMASQPLSIVPKPELKAITSMEQISNDWYARNGYLEMYGALGGGKISWSGEAVNVISALNHSVVWACYRLISETVSFIPLVLYQDQKGGGKDVAKTHPMYRALKNAPNSEMSAMGFRETLTGHCVLQGNAYAQIIRRSGTGVAMEMYPLLPEHVRDDRDKQGRLVYVVKVGNTQEKVFTCVPDKPMDIFHMRGLGNNGIRGFSVIQMGSQSIGTALATEKNLGAFYAHGGRLPYVLNSENDFRTQTELDQFRNNWEEIYGVPHRAPILTKGMKYQQIGINAKDAQLLETRLFSIHEVCRWFGVPPHLVGDLSRATFNNIEELALEFVKLTLSGWLSRWEAELWRCVLTPEEQAQSLEYSWRHNLNALLRGDFTSRMQGYATMLQNGIANQDEVRDLEDWNAIPNGIGTGYHVQLNMQTLPPDGGPLLPPKGPGGEPGADPAPDPKKPGKKPGKKPDAEVGDTGNQL